MSRRSKVYALASAFLPVLSCWSVAVAAADDFDAPPPDAIPIEVVETPTELAEPPTGKVPNPTPSAEPQPQKRTAYDPEDSWPGSFIAPRLGTAMGWTVIPQYSSATPTSSPLGSVFQLSALGGVELGYVPEAWGASVTLDIGWPGLPVAFAGSMPVIGIVGIHLNHVLNQNFRLIAGVEPFSSHFLINTANETAWLMGVGFRIGAHYRFSDWNRRAWEAFGYLTYSTYSRANVGSGGGSLTEVSVGDLTGSRDSSWALLLALGIQLNFRY